MPSAAPSQESASGGEPAFLGWASRGAAAWAVALLFLSFTRAQDSFALAIAAFVLLPVSALLAALRTEKLYLYVPFVLAIPFAVASYLFSGHAAFLASVAFAFEARRWLLRSAARDHALRAGWSEELRRRLPGEVTVFVDNDIESQAAIGALHEGHTFRVAPGQIVPADGTVTYGSGFVDENLLDGHGENLQLKGMGSRVLAGSRNQNGSLLVRATAVGDHTFLARLAKRLEEGTEVSVWPFFALDLAFTALGFLALFFLAAPHASLVFLLPSAVSALAWLERFELGLASPSLSHRWLWRPAGLRKFAKVGMLVAPAEGTIGSGRPKLVATECLPGLSEDAALTLLAPLARKIETPAAFAVLQEIRTRNIPLQQSEFYQPRGAAGGTAIITGEEIGWVSSTEAEGAALSALASFVETHRRAGDEVVLLERQGALAAALAFREEPLPGTQEALRALRENGLPTVLVSPLPKSAVARLQAELGLEHVQGEAGPTEVEMLLQKLAREGLAPAWVQTSPHLPRPYTAVAALPHLPTNADLTLPETGFAALAPALTFAHAAYRTLRRIFVSVGLWQALGVLALTARHGAPPGVYALFGVIPGLYALFPRRPKG